MRGCIRFIQMQPKTLRSESVVILAIRCDTLFCVCTECGNQQPTRKSCFNRQEGRFSHPAPAMNNCCHCGTHGTDTYQLQQLSINKNTANTNRAQSNVFFMLSLCLRIIFRSKLRLAEAVVKAEREHPCAETRQIVRFIESSRRGLISFA